MIKEQLDLNHKLISITILILCCVVQYWNVFGYEIIDWDDPVQIINNEYVNNDISFENTKGIFNSVIVDMYQPLTTLSFNIEKNIFGFSSLTFHAFSILYHTINTLLLFWLLSLIFPNLNNYILIIPCIIFSIHPINNEAVSWLSARSTLISCTFFLLATITYFNYLKKQKHILYFISILFFTLSLYAKVISVSFIFIPFILDYLFGKYQNQKPTKTLLNLSLKIPFIIVSVYFMNKTLNIRYDFIENSMNNEHFSQYDYLLVIIEQYRLYLYNILVPINLQPQYKDPTSISSITYLWLIPIALCTFLIWKHRKNKQIILGSLIFITSLFPVLKLKPMGHSFITDRYAYIALIGIMILITYLLSKYQYKRVYYFFGVIIILISFLSFNNQKTWTNEITIWTKVTDPGGAYHETAFAYEFRANAYKKRGLYNEAIKDIRTAIKYTNNEEKNKQYNQRINTISNLIIQKEIAP